MSRQFAHIIHHLLTDEDLRVRFAINPAETIADLMCRGCELGTEEVEVFVRTDARLWFWSSALGRGRLHSTNAPSNFSQCLTWVGAK